MKTRSLKPSGWNGCCGRRGGSCRLRPVESGDAFLHRAAAGPYAVVFLDICMEGTNGIGTALKRLSIGHGILCNKFAEVHPQIALKTIN